MRAQPTLFTGNLSIDLRQHRSRCIHGGLASKGKRKLARPLDRKKALHLVLKSSKAQGRMSFLLPKNRRLVSSILRQKSKKFGVRVLDFANVGNHLHLKIKINSRESFQKFLISITGLIARSITGAKKGQKFGKFWDALAFTRVLRTQYESLQLKGYFEANRLEAAKSKKARDNYLRQFNDWLLQLKRTRLQTDSAP